MRNRLALGKILRSAPFLSALIAVLSTLAAHWLNSNVPQLADASNEQLDQLAKYFPPITADDALVVVVVDADTPAALGRPKAAEVQLRLADCARAIETLGKGKPDVLLCDLNLGTKHNNDDLVGQQLLAKVAGELGATRLVVPSSPLVNANEDEPKKNPDTLGGFDYRFTDPVFAHKSPNTFIGHPLSLRPSQYDTGINPVLHRYKTTEPILHIAILTTLLYRNSSLESVAIDIDEGTFTSKLGTWDLTPADGLDTLWTRDWRDFKTLSLQDCLRMPRADLERHLAGKIVVLGDIRPGMDEYTKPPKFPEVPGVFYVVNTINTLLKPYGSWPKYAPDVAVLAGCLIASFASAFALTRRSRTWRIAAPIAVIGVCLVAPSLLAATYTLYVNPFELPLSAIIAALLMGAVVVVKSGWFESRVPGALQEAAVLFVDLEDSTGMTVREGARTYQEAFTEFARRAASIVHKCEGTVERTTGDGLIATFEKTGTDHPSFRAYRCATQIVELAKSVSTEFKLPLVANAGLEFGLVSGGYVVEGGKSSWSSSGKTVILAQRLLSVAAQSESRIAIGPSAADFLRELAKPILVGSYRLKGMEGETNVYAIDESFAGSTNKANMSDSPAKAVLKVERPSERPREASDD